MKSWRGFIGGVIHFVVCWWCLSLLTNNRSLPDPLETLERLWTLRHVVLLHAGASFMRVFAALLLALIVGVPLGIFLGKSRHGGQFFSPLIYFLYPIPKVAFLPIFMLFFGLGNQSKVLLIFSVIVIQVIVSIRDAVKEIPTMYEEVLRNYTTTFRHRLYYVIWPALLPALFGSLRVSIGIALASLFFAENYNTSYGVGYLILSAWAKMDYRQMMVGVLIIALMGYGLFAMIDWLEKKVVRGRG
ncbi:ABC transporter permease [Enterococcus sp.]|uniref:ABC transporter permease n=1 Tax=Enterococcus sp. TaxID=35783 RepID=UPI0028AFAAEB|nr:ABC transporter permease [Enterococcus sp.]